jgi:mRNA interferase YafQ
LKFSLSLTSRFKRDAKRIQRRGKDLETLYGIVERLQQGKRLEVKHKDHPLSGSLSGFRECHIEPDWLLLYCIEGKELILVRTGSHSDLFG